MTTIGYLPIIQAPAHDIDTLNTIVQRALHILQALNQNYLVLTVDEALFPKLMELKWSVPEYANILIPRLGGLHISMNFLRVIGQHMQDSGLIDVWIEWHSRNKIKCMLWEAKHMHVLSECTR